MAEKRQQNEQEKRVNKIQHDEKMKEAASSDNQKAIMMGAISFIIGILAMMMIR